MRQIIGLVAVVSLLLYGCGLNNGTSTPVARGSRSSDATVPADGSTLDLSSKTYWRGELVWDHKPSFQHDQLVELSGHIYLRTESGAVPGSVTQLKLSAIMPELGRGTGKFLPQIHVDESDAGHFLFDNLFMTSTGLWRLQISATVDERFDTWTRSVDLK